MGRQRHIGSHPLGYQVAGTGDFNHDGTDDVLWYNPTNGKTEIWKIVNGQWSATFDLGSHPAGWAPAGVGDFNHDGTDDIAWYNATTRNIDIWQIVNGKWNGSFDVGSHPAGWAPAGDWRVQRRRTRRHRLVQFGDRQRRHLADRERALGRERQHRLSSAQLSADKSLEFDIANNRMTKLCDLGGGAYGPYG